MSETAKKHKQTYLMAKTNLLQNRVADTPVIYAYELVGVPSHKGLLKVGYTVCNPEVRVAEQLKTANVDYRIVLKRNAMRKDGSSFDDHAVHRVLRRNGVHNPEGEWFRKVTGLTLKDFSLLVSLNVFNSELMNDAVYKFKRYEDDSLEYTGISTHDGRMIGGWDTVIDTQKIKTEPIVEEVPDCSIEVSTTTGIIEDTPTHDGVSESPVTSDETVAVKSWTELTIGDTVTHKSLGPGTVMSFNEKYIIIKFRDRESKFIYPGAFEKGYFE